MKNIFLLVLTISFFNCQRTSSDSNTQNNSSTEEKVELTEGTVEAIPETAKEKVARMQTANKSLKAPSALGDMPSKMEIKPSTLCQNKYGCLSETIYPLGWSADGKFAYCIEYPTEAADMYRMDFFILDLTTGEMVDQASFKGELTLTFQEIWTNKQIDFVEDMSKHNIQPANDFDIKTFPLNWQDHLVSTSVDKKMQKSDYTGKEVVMESKLTVNGTDLGSQQIANETYGKYDLVLDTEVIGYLKNPFEDRILVVYAKEKRGFEGPPNVTSFSFIDCDLTTWE